MRDAFIWSQVHETNPNPYHQIIVLSQSMINSALDNMYFHADHDSPLVKFSLDLPVGNIDAVLEAPRISLQVTSPKVYYYIKFESGTMNLRKSEYPEDSTTKAFVVSDWGIAFSATIKRKIVKEGDTEYPAYATKLGFKSGVFSIAKLFLHVSTSTDYCKERSSFGDVDWDKESSTVRANFRTLMMSWISDASKNERNLLGYSILGEDPGQVNTTAPTFVPTSIDYCNYPWSEPGTSTVEMADDLDKNALCYLTVSNIAAPDPVGLPYSGAFVQDGGIFCMNSDLFWNWLLSLLRELCQITEMVPLEPMLFKNEFSRFSSWSYKAFPRLTFGFNPDHLSKDDHYFDWKKDTNSETTWAWTGDELRSSKTLTTESGEVIASESSKSSASVTFDIGGRTIAIQGTMEFQFTHGYVGTNRRSCLESKSKWHLNFALQSVDDGGLQIIRVPDPPSTVPCQTTHTESVRYTDFGSIVDKWIKLCFKKGLGWLTNALITVLQKQHRLFLPASGIFLMQDPRFNRRGDILVTLKYNGAPPPSTQSTCQDSNAQQRHQKNSTTAKHPDTSIPDLFHHIPKEFQKLPRRQCLVPPECLREEFPAPSFSSFPVQAHT